MNVNFNIDINSSHVETFYFRKENPDHKISSGLVRTVYQVLNIDDMISGDKKTYFFPDEVGITMLSLSVSHARAIFAKNMAGTVLQDILPPIVNPTEMWHQLRENFIRNDITTDSVKT